MVEPRRAHRPAAFARPPNPAAARRGRPLIAALLPCLIPGAGQLYLGHRRRGAAMLVVTALCVVVAVVLASEPIGRVPHAGAAAVAAGPARGRRRAAVPGGGGARRLPAGPAGQSPGAGPEQRLAQGAAAGLVVVVALTAAPARRRYYYDLQAYDLLTSVFAGEDPQWQARDCDRHQTGNGLVTAIPGRVTVLLLGGDAGPGRQGRRTDTMMVASFEVATGKVSLFGLPRNLVQVPLPDGPAADYFGECRCFPRLLNELYAFAEDERPDLFPHSARPSIAAVAGAAESCSGCPSTTTPWSTCSGSWTWSTPSVGSRSTTSSRSTSRSTAWAARAASRRSRSSRGASAERLHRPRLLPVAETTSDYDRLQRQRCVIGSLARQTQPAEVLAAFPKLVKVLKRSVATDIPASRLPALIEAAGDQPVKVATVGFTPPTYNSAGHPAT